MAAKQKGPWQKALEHLIVGMVLIISGATWAPRTISGSFLVSAGVNQALSWARPDGLPPSSFITSPIASIKQYSYEATSNTVKAVARVMVWLVVFIGFIGWGLVELRLMLGCGVDGLISAAKRVVGIG